MVATEIYLYDPSDSSVVEVNQLNADLDLISLMVGKRLHINAVRLQDAQIDFIRNENQKDFTFLDFINKAFASSDSVRKDPMPVIIDNIALDKATYAFNNRWNGRMTREFNGSLFTVDEITAEISGLHVYGDSVRFFLKSLSAIEKYSGVQVSSMQTLFTHHDDGIWFDSLQLTTPNSSISNSFRIKVFDKDDYADFINRAALELHLNAGDFIGTKDLAAFTPVFDGLDQTLYVEGDIYGPISNIRTESVKLGLGQSYLNGNFWIDGLPRTDALFIQARIASSHLEQPDLLPFVPADARKFVAGIPELEFEGEYVGFLTDFVAYGDFTSPLGNLSTDVNIKILEQAPFQYSGNVETNQLQIGKVLDFPKLGRVTMKGNISGSGLTLENASFDLEASFDQLELLDYSYSNIRTDASFAQSYFNGNLEIRDPNLSFVSNAVIDLREGNEIVSVLGNFDTVNFHKINLTEDTIFFRSLVDIDFRGLEPDSIEGKAYLSQSQIILPDRSLYIDTLSLSIEKQQGLSKSIHLGSSYLDADIAGTFSYSNVAPSLEALIREYLNVFIYRPDSVTTIAEAAESIELDYTLNLKNIDPILSLLDIPVYISENASFEGTLITGDENFLRFYGNIDTISYENYALYNNQLDINASKLRNNLDVLAAVFFFSESQKLGELNESRSLLVDAFWNDSLIAFDQEIFFDSAHFIDLKGGLTFGEDSLQIRFAPSNIFALDAPWKMLPGNNITVRGREINISNLQFSQRKEKVRIDGVISEDADQVLDINIENLELDVLNGLVRKELSGVLNADISLRNVYNGISLDNKIDVYGLSVSNFLVGDINGYVNLDTAARQFNIDYLINREGTDIISTKGYYRLYGDNPLELNATFQDANLNIIEPFIDDIFTNLAGTLTGNFSISGSPNRPIVEGNGKIQQGNIRVNYLNTSYKLDGPIFFDRQKVTLDNIAVTDTEGDRGTLGGSIYFNDLNNIRLDLNASMTNFSVLNTTARLNDYFYGSAQVTGTASITGPANNLLIRAQATSNRGTRLFIPVNYSQNVQQKDYITFVSFTDSTYVEKNDEPVVKTVDLSGINLDLDLNVTPDAYTEIIFDIKTGDIIRARGDGRLNLQIDSEGAFSMVGNHTIQSGGYNFTLYNIINKEFELLPGGTITWSGDPYNAQLDLKASYNQLTSLEYVLPQVSPADEGSGDGEVDDIYDVPPLKRKYPAQVILDLQGDLMSPEIDFTVGISDYPNNITLADGSTENLDLLVNQFINNLENDEQELKRQIFSLLILRRLSYPNAFSSGVANSNVNAIENSVSELISNQLSYWISQVDQNLEVDIDLAALDEEAFNTFQLRLSYTFLDGRLRITRAGGVTNGTTATETGQVPVETSVATIAGDWTVEYLLTPDGKLKAKMYNRTTPATVIAEQTNTVAGFSIELSQNFDNVRELFRKARQRGQEERGDPENPENTGAVLRREETEENN